VKDSLKIKGFIATTDKDFKHTLELLKKAGVTRDFGFKY
jgi:tRNA A37 methylthiotransferase MiaB